MPEIKISWGERQESKELLRCKLNVLVVSDNEWKARATWRQMKQLQDFFYEKFNVAFFVEVGDWLPSEEVGVALSKFPALLFIDQARLHGNTLGEAQGEFATVALAHENFIEIAEHELGHLFGLQHNEESFMHPKIEVSKDLPVLESERKLFREAVRRYGSG